MQTPTERFAAVPAAERELLGLRVPAVLAAVPAPRTELVADVPDGSTPDAPETNADAVMPLVVPGGPVEFERVVPACGNPQVAGKQFWLGPARSGLSVTFWADTAVIHLLVAGARIKTVRSHLSVTDLTQLAARGGRAAGPSPLPTGEGCAFEVDRTVNNSGLVGLGRHQVQRLRQAALRERAGDRWAESDYVFTTRTGRPIEPRNVYRSFTRVAGNAGLRVIRLHDARHGTATLLTAAGVAPRVVMEILGHSQIAVTMNVYTHVVQDTQREAVSHMDRLLRRRLDRE
ncbi:site-specific integrase [Streptomyces sp. CB01635]|uniref:tyrosine-type recombinase/integrase n=1 Tax=Streptomyces sp. NPDC000188 TaxID=3154245 RepID=UPI002D782FA8|nr:site-specific integrase [Streptomyces sp. CB01635]